MSREVNTPWRSPRPPCPPRRPAPATVPGTNGQNITEALNLGRWLSWEQNPSALDLDSPLPLLSAPASVLEEFRTNGADVDLESMVSFKGTSPGEITSGRYDEISLSTGPGELHSARYDEIPLPGVTGVKTEERYDQRPILPGPGKNSAGRYDIMPSPTGSDMTIERRHAQFPLQNAPLVPKSCEKAPLSWEEAALIVSRKCESVENINFIEYLMQGLSFDSLDQVLPKQKRRIQSDECTFCKNNGEYWTNTQHMLKDKKGKVLCPVLRAYTCPRCGATGDHAHTVKFCPYATPEDHETSISVLKKTRWSSSGRRRHQPFN